MQLRTSFPLNARNEIIGFIDLRFARTDSTMNELTISNGALTIGAERFRFSFIISGSDLTDPNDGVVTRYVIDFGDAGRLDISDFSVSFDDFVSFTTAGGTNRLVQRIGAGDDRFTGSAGDDQLRSYGGDDTMTGGDGSDELVADAGDDVITAGAGDDTVFAGMDNDRAVGGAGDDLINLGAGQDRGLGGGGDDLIRGQGGGDTIFGGGGDDLLNGSGGRDTLTGGRGDDTLIGGGGADSFVFTANSGDDLIRQFQTARDQIDLSAVEAISDFDALLANANDGAAGVEITLSAASSVVIAGTSAAGLSEGNFIFL